MASVRNAKRVCETDEDPQNGPQRQPRKKQDRRRQAFRKQYSERWSCLQEGRKGENFCWCMVCQCEFSIAHGSQDDCRRHVESKKHKDFEISCGHTRKISGFFASSSASKAESTDEVIRAEVMLVDLVAELNLPFTVLDTFTKAFKLMFKDSDVAKKFQCGRSKGTAIIKEIAAKTSISLADRLKNQPFTISTDGSNDAGCTKLFPLVARTFDADTLQVQSEVLAVPACQGSATGERIFALTENEFHVHNIPFDNCLGLGSDNANVMVGAERGVYGRLRETSPWAHLSGCVCHLIHIAAEKGAACLPLNVDQLLIDVYYYLDKSSKRQAAFKDMQLHHDIKENKILKHVSTRWLSVTKCLSRLLENWDALYEFFKEQEKNATGSAETERAAKLRKLFQSPTNCIACFCPVCWNPLMPSTPSYSVRSQRCMF